MSSGFTVLQAGASVVSLLLISSAITHVLGAKLNDDINRNYYTSAEIDPYDDYKHSDYSQTYNRGESELYDVIPVDEHLDYSSYQHDKTSEFPVVSYNPKPKVSFEVKKETKKVLVDKSVTQTTASIATSLKVLIIMLAILAPAMMLHFFVVPAKMLLGMAFIGLMTKLTLGLLLYGFMKKKHHGGFKGKTASLRSVPHGALLQFLRDGGIDQLTSEEVDAIIDLAVKKNNKW
ncbi:uncharacterized protein LOC129726134 [Wyeomyia smithii]|uniref:uncharacterized protein LOC129726134 n=1 Tax=Wyeomyia smithii TaxID=174621 RepID=UPI002467C5B5|nr:uncharacterized protein LOC129726134 [Wyeomyia smithii]